MRDTLNNHRAGVIVRGPQESYSRQLDLMVQSQEYPYGVEYKDSYPEMVYGASKGSYNMVDHMPGGFYG